MRTSLLGKIFFGTAAGLLWLGKADAQVLLNVSWNSSTHVITFTGTGNHPSDPLGGAVSFADGLTLENFFTSQVPEAKYDSYVDLSVFSHISTTLSDNVGANFFTHLYTEAFDADTLYNDLNISNAAGSGTNISMTTGSAALNGVFTKSIISESGFWSIMPSVGSTGNIYFGLSGNNQGLIGTYAVVSAVPEPSSYAACFGLATLGFVAWRRRYSRLG
jgi:hypothetical protein